MIDQDLNLSSQEKGEFNNSVQCINIAGSLDNMFQCVAK